MNRLILAQRELETINGREDGITIYNLRDKYAYYETILYSNIKSRYIEEHYTNLIYHVREFIDKYQNFIKLNMEQYFSENGICDIVAKYL